jgi:DNA repair exonuclease SbcCD ATPase subunit
VQGANAQQVGCRIAEIEKEIEYYMTERETLTERLARYGRVLALRGRWKEMLDEREAAKGRVQDASCDALLQRLISLTEDHITLARVELMECEKEISAHRLLQGAVDQLKVQIEDAQENVRALTAITEELSPKSGLIAKTVSHFLNVVIGSINQVIAGVWDYKMVLSPIDVESESLNYRFKVQVQDRLIVDDVSKVSAGMREIINLAMKVTLYKLLRLDGYPMFLDEFGVKLDATHRARVADIIFKMMASPTYSQIFLVTHLDLAYADFKDTEVIDLTP